MPISFPQPSPRHRPLDTQPIDPQHVDEGVDRINLKQVSARFQQVNKTRLQRLHSALNTQQQVFLDLLPLLFHVNHPVLPGYISADTPAGIKNYKPSRESILSARSLSKSFALQRDPNAVKNIRGVYLMGSCGSIAHNRHSDIDIWVCPEHGIDEKQQKELQQKCEKVQQWANSLRIETHFFIMDDVEFRKQQRAEMGIEDCGSTQHFLLLDEFYRSSIVAGGCTPIWWLVPNAFNDDYQHYVDTLAEKRFIDRENCIDYGSIQGIPTSEYISAGIWQLYKSLASPYKAVLKLLLIEVYASEHPTTVNLSTLYKERLFNGQYESDDNDPYVATYKKIEHYLQQRNELDRLELVRKCFYFKVGVALSSTFNENMIGANSPDTTVSQGHNPFQIDRTIKNISAQRTQRQQNNHAQWQRSLMHKLTQEWGWDKTQLIDLDNRQNWSISQIKQEQHRLTRELTQSYRLLNTLVQKQNSDNETTQEHVADEKQALQSEPSNSNELTLLGRKIYASFERKANKLSKIQPGIVSSLEKDHVTFRFSKQNSQNETDALNPPQSNIGIWSIYSGILVEPESNVEIDTDEVESGDEKKASLPVTNTLIHTGTYLTETLAWCISNRIIGSKTRIHVVDGEHDLTDYEVRQLQNIILENLSNHDHGSYTSELESAQSQFSRAASIDRCIYIVNAGIDPLKSQKDQGIHRISDRTDPLAYSGIQENLIIDITQIAINNWGEIFCHHYNGISAIDQCLTQYFCYAKPGSESALPSRAIYCACPSRPNAIVDRLENLFDDIETCYFDNSATCDKSTGSYYEKRRYLFESAECYHLMQWHEGNPLITQQTSDEALFKKLSDAELAGPLILDRFALQQHPLHTVNRTVDAALSKAKLIASNASGDNILRVFYLVKDQVAETYIIDQNQVLTMASIPFESTRSFILPMTRFIEHSVLRQHTQLTIDLDSNTNRSGPAKIHYPTEVPSIEFYMLNKTHSGYSTTAVPTESNISANYLPIKAVGSQGIVGDIDWVFYCDDKAFEASILGDQVFAALAKSIQSHRQSSDTYYRCYITDIEVTCMYGDNSNLAQDLQYKLELEEKLNQAFLSLRSDS